MDSDQTRAYEQYRMLVDLWAKENPIKTAKLQVLLAVNAFLVGVLNASGGLKLENIRLLIAGAIFCVIWTFSIGRTSLFQDVWQLKIRELSDQFPDDPRFQVLRSEKHIPKTRRLVRVFGCLPSKYYLLWSPCLFAMVWIILLIITVQK